MKTIKAAFEVYSNDYESEVINDMIKELESDEKLISCLDASGIISKSSILESIAYHLVIYDSTAQVIIYSDNSFNVQDVEYEFFNNL